tara:strand:+ start:402 stop:551 length:150 start_codon:yes stop_codon:yes gene_type:complete
LNTIELAKKFKVKVPTVHDAKWRLGHFKGYEPCGYEKPGGHFIWRFVGL